MKNALENLSPVEVKALAALVSKTTARKASEAITVGNTLVDFTVRVHGSITRGADYEQQIVGKADPWLLLVVALSHLNGVTVESITREALTADPNLVVALKAEAKKAVEKVKVPTQTPCNGKVTATLVAEKIS